MAKRTPIGELVYPYLNEADTKYDADGLWQTKLALPAEIAQPLIDEIDAQLEATLAEAKKAAKPQDKNKWEIKSRPYDLEYDAEGNETGRILLKFKQRAIIKKKDGTTSRTYPLVADRLGKPLIVRDNTGAIVSGPVVGHTSRGVVAYNFRPYAVGIKEGATLTLSLVGVQISKLVEGSASNIFGTLEDEEEDHGTGFGVLAEEEPTPAPAARSAPPAARKPAPRVELDDEIPF